MKDLNSLEKLAMSGGINRNDVYPENFNFTEIDSLKEHFKRKDRTTPIDIGRLILYSRGTKTTFSCLI